MEEGSKFSGMVCRSDVELAKELRSARAEYESWEVLGAVEVHGSPVKLHRKALDSGLYEIYAHGTLPIAAEELVDMNWDVDYRVTWDDNAKKIVVHTGGIEHEGVVQDLLHWEVKFPWPMSNRDYVFVRHKSITDDGRHILISKGASHPELQEQSGVVRVDLLRNLMSIEKVSDNQLSFQMLYFDDLKGSIPTWVVNWAVSKAVPAFLNSLVNAAKKKREQK